MAKTWLDDAKEMAAAVCNGRTDDPEECVYLPLGGVAEGLQILTHWLTQVPEGVRRQAQVKYGNEGAQADTAFVMLRERRLRVADTGEAQQHA